jgi:hypothetical protein
VVVAGPVMICPIKIDVTAPELVYNEKLCGIPASWLSKFIFTVAPAGTVILFLSKARFFAESAIVTVWPDGVVVGGVVGGVVDGDVVGGVVVGKVVGGVVVGEVVGSVVIGVLVVVVVDGELEHPAIDIVSMPVTISDSNISAGVSFGLLIYFYSLLYYSGDVDGTRHHTPPGIACYLIL